MTLKKKRSEASGSNIKASTADSDKPDKAAWFTAFYIENHLDWYTFPDHAATDEQVRFMIYTENGERYFPCSDQMFKAIMQRKKSPLVQQEYADVLERILDVITEKIEDTWEKQYLESLIRIKHKHETRDQLMIPSRLEKRLMSIFLKRTQIEDPFQAEKLRRNRKAVELLESAAFYDALNHVDRSEIDNPPETLSDIKKLLGIIEFKRLISLCALATPWDNESHHATTRDDLLDLISKPIQGNGNSSLLNALGFLDCSDRGNSKKILWLADESGEVVLDLFVIRFLIKQGHKVIIAFKDGPLFTKALFKDAEEEEFLSAVLNQALLVHEKNMGKNELVRLLRSDKDIFIISDNTSENLNLLLTSTTFARFFKEVDLVVSRGVDQKRRFFDTHFQFTQDIYNISADEQGQAVIAYKPRHEAVIKFSHQDLENKAKTIVDRMENAKKNNMTVMFYSGIIGSIPGRIQVAKKVMSIFVEYLKEYTSKTFIINPSEYFEFGMDADDLMYMWEIVQRSGLIDIWRFQTYDDIVKAFELMRLKVPPEWVGKDATFSTGCTKEMNIALDVQRKYREMQIIGPAKEKFMRRAEYGVGKMYDRVFADVSVS
ncbi:MAG: DUF89 family protein [Desulfobacteraceae bacterium]|nr:DUF89 family protein [Desulfobacteraceae bacterium]